jgi:acyl-CoA thioester hydrolase
VNNLVYVRWVQDVAVAHWRTLATAEEQSSVVWVVVRHEIDYKRSAGPDETVVLRTWVGKAVGMTFERFTEILRSADRALLVRARTLWCPVDIRTRRPLRVGGEIRARFSVSDGPS